MNWKLASRWVSVLLLVVGCNAKLQVEPGPGAAGAAPLTMVGTAGRIDDGCQLTGTCGGAGPESSGAGGAIDLPSPGRLGQKCIPGGSVTEADGSEAKAVIGTLDRCDEGLTCNAKKVCAPTPDCPQKSGICLVRRADLGGSGGVGGAFGGGGISGSFTAGAGGNGPGVPPISAESGVLGLATNDADLYWVEYGTRDSLGNYMNDGAVRALTASNGKTRVLASGLHGPTRLGVTSTHAYVWVDGAGFIGSPQAPQLLRIPIGGGSPEVIQDGNEALPGEFVAVADRAIWTTFDNVYSLDSTEGATATVLHAGFAHGLSSDGTDLYFYGVNYDDALQRVPLAGGTQEAVGTVSGPYAVHGDSIYVLDQADNATGALLSQRPKSGGALKRIRALGTGTGEKLEFFGDRYVLANFAPGQGRYVSHLLTASLTGDETLTQLIELPYLDYSTPQPWVATATTVYWTNRQAIYSAPSQ